MRLILLAIAVFAFSCKHENSTSPKVIPLNPTSKTDLKFNWQGHRGARGLAPENTMPAFMIAIENNVNTLEMDVAITKDNKVIISHEPWISSKYCQYVNGKKITEADEENLIIYQMNAAEIRQFDCGSIANPEFPEQRQYKMMKPTLQEIVNLAQTHTGRKGVGHIYYNIEIKSKPEWDGIFTPLPDEFAKILLDELDSLKVTEFSTIQSFDVRALQAVKKLNPAIETGLLVENETGLDANLQSLGFTPTYYSPYFKLVTKELVEAAHQKGMKVIPWTVNEVADMKNLVALGVDGIITDYPNRKFEVE